MTLNVAWLLVLHGWVCVFQKLLIYSDFHTQPSLGFTENGPKLTEYENIQWVVWTKMPCWCQRSQENGQTEGNSNSKNNSLQPSYAEYHLWMYNIRQQKIGKTLPSLTTLDFIQMVARIWCKQHKRMDPSCLISTVQTSSSGVVTVYRTFSFTHLSPLSTYWALFKYHRLPAYCC